MRAFDLAWLFHQTYEKLAPSFGYETREETRDFDPGTPNGKLMLAVAEEVIKRLKIQKVLMRNQGVSVDTFNGKLPNPSLPQYLVVQQWEYETLYGKNSWGLLVDRLVTRTHARTK